MLHRKIYQLYSDRQEVCLFLKDQQRWIEKAKITDIEGDLVIVRYESEEEDEICAWEEMIRLESIGSIQRKLSSVPRGASDLLVAEDCPEAERYPSQDSNAD